MKDDRLEKEFDEYFKGVNISDDITADAKKSVKSKRNIMPKIVKFASIAASIVLVFAVSLAVILKTDFNKVTDPSDGNTSGNEGSLPDDGNSGDSSGAPDNSSGDSSNSAPDSSNGDNSSGAPDSSSGNNSSGGASSGGAVKYEFYTDDDLVISVGNAYSLSSLDPSLKFIENFALADNASVETCTTGYMDGELALVKAEVSILSGLNRDETTVYVEFTDTNLIYSGLSDYYDGKVYEYLGAQYYLTAETGKNGEPEFKLHILYGGVKYYFNVHSSDESAFKKYLDLIVKK